ncbi:cyclic AMP-responsive element-binding protein 3-like protein 3-B isoform X2 [Denticeps clupeoides]|uniref:cyclic AMP-responsive element-binding protein 3-like protein 3-B isoform X2 n=1 Tax=Denticeps clupeoides TaxID=299321 RepID=UPI0010A53D99|nr:cyclic AMP-responsive element-binding protein 3-like protein 3-B isoform X2 [Denticeps clupeoides]
MALISEKNCGELELFDLLFEPSCGMLPLQGDGDHGYPTSPIMGSHQTLSSRSSAEDFLDALLGCNESVPCAPASPLWASSPSDSGISEDPQSDNLDSPPPPLSPLFESFFFPHVPQIPLHHQHLQQQTQQIVTAQSAGAVDQDIAIDLGEWDGSFYSGRSMEAQSHPPTRLHQQCSIYPLTVKDLLLSSIGEQAQQARQTSQQDLMLSEDEKRLLAKEGFSLPSQLPLTKQEEKILKKIRRKIRNKQSAQESRKKKKDYIDGLEGRMAACSAQNIELQRKVFQLEKTNTSLLEQLRRLQALVMTGSNKPAQTGTCVMFAAAVVQQGGE